jgi:hypothetical protein
MVSCLLFVAIGVDSGLGGFRGMLVAVPEVVSFDAGNVRYESGCLIERSRKKRYEERGRTFPDLIFSRLSQAPELS